MTPLETPITNIIREAILNHTHRDFQINEISSELMVGRHKAKTLFFAFLWHAEESFLERVLLDEDPVWVP